jgi:hypothetical protein
LKVGYVNKVDISIHSEWIGKWKVMVSRANNIGTELNDDNLNTLVLAPNYVCTESYIIIGAELNLNEESANNLASYLKTTFARFLHSLAKSSQDATAKTYRFVPLMDFSQKWDDTTLYEYFKLSDAEVNLIEESIMPME